MLKNNKANDALIMLCYTCAFGAFGAFFRWLQMQVARDTETGMINPSILNILLPLLIVAAAVVLWLRTRKLTDDQTVFPTGMSEARSFHTIHNIRLDHRGARRARRHHDHCRDIA